MHQVRLDHPGIRSLTIVGELNDGTENADVWADLHDGRRFGFTVFSLRGLDRLLKDSAAFVSPGMLVVRQLSDDAIVDAVVAAAAVGIDQVGVLQAES